MMKKERVLREVWEKCSSGPWKTCGWVQREQECRRLDGEDGAGLMAAMKGVRRCR